uniref:Uncharacterized protein n=1 Tax=Romanomermis culicivorax TaxID=13658 RepID=A0A915L3F5_ROMCU
MEIEGIVLDEQSIIEPDWKMDKRYHFRIPEEEDDKEQNRQVDYSKVQSIHEDYEDKQKRLHIAKPPAAKTVFEDGGAGASAISNENMTILGVMVDI